MADTFYPTASTCAIFLNGIHIEQAFRVDYKESLPRTPIFGYNDTYFTKVARGKNLIQGLIILNFTVPFYLNAVLDKQSNAFVPKLYNYELGMNNEASKQAYQESITNKLATELPPNHDETTRNARAEYIASLLTSKDPNKQISVERALYEFFNPDQDGEISAFNEAKRRPVSIDSPLINDQLTENGVILDVYYSDPSNAVWFCRFTNVHIFDVSQQISQAGAEGSSEPLYEIYSFIAQKREVKLVTQNG